MTDLRQRGPDCPEGCILGDSGCAKIMFPLNESIPTSEEMFAGDMFHSPAKKARVEEKQEVKDKKVVSAGESHFGESCIRPSVSVSKGACCTFRIRYDTWRCELGKVMGWRVSLCLL